MAWVYILKCSDDSLYVGSTTDLDERLAQHAGGGGAAYTTKRMPVELMWAQEFDRIDEAWTIERRLHGWGRAKRQALIDGRFSPLPDLSRNANGRRLLGDG